MDTLFLTSRFLQRGTPLPCRPPEARSSCPTKQLLLRRCIMASFKPLALALFLVPASLAAQDSAPEFHAGQWALQFGGNLDLATFGIIRFSGPRSALVLNFDVAGQVLKGTLIQSSVGIS